MISGLVSGCAGLIRSEVCTYYGVRLFTIQSVDKNSGLLFLVLREIRDGIKED